jgi:glycosyltransferase involved in cell wall biosynthesis
MPDLPNTDHLVAVSDRTGGPAPLGTAAGWPKKLTVMQLLPELESGGVERGTIEIAMALKAAGHRAIVVSAGGRMVAELEALGVQHITLPIGKKSLWTLRYVSTLRRLFVAQGVDIVHLRSRVPAWVGWLAWRRMDPATRPRLVTTVHGPYSTNAYSAVMLRGERVIAVSDMIVDYIHLNYPWVAPQRIHRIYRGVDPAAFPEGYQPGAAWLAQWRNEFPQLRNRWVLTLPGRITRWKGQLDLLEIVARLKAEGVPVHALIVGGTHPRKRRFLIEIEAEIAARGLGADVTLVGQRSDLREIMAVSDVVLSLSTDPEAFGRVSLEALTLGRPVLGYAHGGVGEQLSAMYPAGAIRLGDIDAAVSRLRDWHAHGAPLVPNERPFTLRAMQDQTLAVYEELWRSPRVLAK